MVFIKATSIEFDKNWYRIDLASRCAATSMLEVLLHSADYCEIVITSFHTNVNEFILTCLQLL